VTDNDIALVFQLEYRMSFIVLAFYTVAGTHTRRRMKNSAAIRAGMCALSE